ncbi:MAG: GPI inositol-deacylase [Arenicella sp.]|nr:GPI inositol-deacylase [Arenicella sp.]
MPDTIRNVRGAALLTFDCLAGITSTVRQMHGAIASRALPLSLSKPDSGEAAPGMISKAVYAGIQSAIHGLRKSADISLDLFNDDSDTALNASGHGLALRSILNGICGDHLETTNNTLSAPMCFTTPEIIPRLSKANLETAIPDASGNVAVYVHGLCLSTRSWVRDNRPSIGDKLKESANLTPLYLQYNTGRHISTNGRELAAQLNELMQAWPEPIKSLSLIGHSMGGLVIRSACWYAEQEGYAWPRQLKRVLFLGTPHHGAPLEKAGHLLSVAMHSSPYLAPLDLGKHRSAGIKDLRFGNLLDEDWHGQICGQATPDARRPVPLLKSVDYYFIAATIGQNQHDLTGHAFGDLLVRSGSAIGDHAESHRALDINPANCRILHRRNHFDLLTDGIVQDQIIEWFSGES